MKQGGTQLLTPPPTEAARWREIGVTTGKQLEQENTFNPATVAAIRRVLASQRGGN
jgi:hypothetical protein